MMGSLQDKGIDITYSYIISEKDDRVFYKPGHLLQKAVIVLRAFRKRLKDLRRARQFDLIYIYREAYMLGFSYFEKKLSQTGVPVIYDFDDAIWLNDTSHANNKLKWLKRPGKTSKIIRHAQLTLAGNAYLADYARKYSRHVAIFPTLLDTDYHKPGAVQKDGPVIIGWTGTSTTLKHFETALPVLRGLKEKYGRKIEIRVIVDFDYSVPGMGITCHKWDKNREIDDLARFDIGIMPLPNDEWSRGKCGFKALQYLALGIPAVVSPVGVNKEIIKNNLNGYLAADEKEWFNKLEVLIENQTLREKMGAEGRKTVVENYSAHAWKTNFLGYLDQAKNASL